MLSPCYRCGIAVDPVRAAGLQIWADRTLWTQFKHNHRSHNNELFGLKLCVYIDKQMAECVIGKKKRAECEPEPAGQFWRPRNAEQGNVFQNRPSETAVRALRIWKCCRGRDQETMKKWWNSWTSINEGQEWRFQTKKKHNYDETWKTLRKIERPVEVSEKTESKMWTPPRVIMQNAVAQRCGAKPYALGIFTFKVFYR